MTARIGSLFSGYGGLDMGVMSVLDADVAWHVEWDKAPSKILDYHWPDVPNYGDVTAVDWSAVEPVDILTGGFPCQDVSLAGRRAGMSEGTRSGLWSEFARAIDVLRPQVVVIENVRGLLSATANSDMEPCTWCVGEESGEPTLRALGAVLGDLADLGYDASWCGLQAADVGAPHGRFRVFIVAYASSGGGGGRATESRQAGGNNAVVGSGSGRAGARVTVADTLRYESERCGGRGAVGGASCGDEGAGEQRQRVRDTTSNRGETVADTNWGKYAPAVRRWEATTSRIAPPPTVPDGRDGNHRLSAYFVEWMMGLNAGHVTDAGLTRNEQLRALGNGVVPLQAAAAVRYLLTSVNAGMTVGRSA
jgi:DNA (cytosine-5)-methyltransferase 1